MEMDKIIDSNNQLIEIENLILDQFSEEDRKIMENLQTSFISFFQISKEQISNVFDLSNRFSAIISWSNFINQIALRYISFIRQISEFEQLSLNDRIILTKYNLFPIFPLSKCYNYKHEYTCPYDSAEEAAIHQQFFSLLDASNDIGDSFLHVTVSLIEITEQDPTLLSLLLLTLFFTPGLSMSEDQPPLDDSLTVHRIQCYYTKLLWNYLLSQKGEIESCRRFNQILSLIFQMQRTTKNFRTFFRDQCTALDIVEQITPLMQSVLHIS